LAAIAALKFAVKSRSVIAFAFVCRYAESRPPPAIVRVNSVESRPRASEGATASAAADVVWREHPAVDDELEPGRRGPRGVVVEPDCAGRDRLEDGGQRFTHVLRAGREHQQLAVLRGLTCAGHG
jgi:hypothetical protein